MSLTSELYGARYVAVAMDVSGGIMPEMLDRAYKLIDDSLVQLSKDLGYRVRLDIWGWDTEVREGHMIFAPYTRGDINGFKPYYGGGSLVDSNWRYMAQNNLNPDVLVIVTDGYIEVPKMKSKAKVVWAIYDLDQNGLVGHIKGAQVNV